MEQQASNARKKIRLASNLHDRTRLDEIVSDRCKVLHMRPNDDRGTRRGGLDDIVAASRRDGTAHEDGIGHRKDAGKFAHRVQEKNPGQLEGVRTLPRAALVIQASIAQFRSDLIETGWLARSENQKQVRDLTGDLSENIENYIVFIDLMRYQTSLLIRADRTRRYPDVSRTVSVEFQRFGRSGRVVLQIGFDPQFLWRYTQFEITVVIDFALNNNQIRDIHDRVKEPLPTL